jgi:hypothetical protein
MAGAELRSRRMAEFTAESRPCFRYFNRKRFNTALLEGLQTRTPALQK